MSIYITLYEMQQSALVTDNMEPVAVLSSTPPSCWEAGSEIGEIRTGSGEARKEFGEKRSEIKSSLIIFINFNLLFQKYIYIYHWSSKHLISLIWFLYGTTRLSSSCRRNRFFKKQKGSYYCECSVCTYMFCEV